MKVGDVVVVTKCRRVRYRRVGDIGVIEKITNGDLNHKVLFDEPDCDCDTHLWFEESDLALAKSHLVRELLKELSNEV